MREIIQLTTHRDQELVDITTEVRAVVARSGVHDGLFQVYAQGATAAIMIQRTGTTAFRRTSSTSSRSRSRRESGDMTPKTATATPTSRRVWSDPPRAFPWSMASSACRVGRTSCCFPRHKPENFAA